MDDRRVAGRERVLPPVLAVGCLPFFLKAFLGQIPTPFPVLFLVPNLLLLPSGPAGPSTAAPVWTSSGRAGVGPADRRRNRCPCARDEGLSQRSAVEQMRRCVQRPHPADPEAGGFAGGCARYAWPSRPGVRRARRGSASSCVSGGLRTPSTSPPRACVPAPSAQAPGSAPHHRTAFRRPNAAPSSSALNALPSCSAGPPEPSQGRALAHGLASFRRRHRLPCVAASGAGPGGVPAGGCACPAYPHWSRPDPLPRQPRPASSIGV